MTKNAGNFLAATFTHTLTVTQRETSHKQRRRKSICAAKRLSKVLVEKFGGTKSDCVKSVQSSFLNVLYFCTYSVALKIVIYMILQTK